MTTLLRIVALLNLLAGCYFLLVGPVSLGVSILGGALVAGFGFAVLERLDAIAAALAKPPAPVLPPVPKDLPPIADFDTAKAVEAMREAQRVTRS